MKDAWPRIRAGLLALHVVAIVLLAFPGGSKLGNRARWKTRITQTQLKLWAERFRGWGWEGTDDLFEAKLWRLAQRYLRARALVTAPVAPYRLVAPQGWGMFKAPPLKPIALAVDVREGRTWRTVHRSRSPEHDYLAWQLEQNRFRKQIGRIGRDRVLFDQIATWIAQRAFDDFPKSRQVRVRAIQLTSVAPDARRAGTVPKQKNLRHRIFRRGQLP